MGPLDNIYAIIIRYINNIMQYCLQYLEWFMDMDSKIYMYMGIIYTNLRAINKWVHAATVMWEFKLMNPKVPYSAVLISVLRL